MRKIRNNKKNRNPKAIRKERNKEEGAKVETIKLKA